MSAPAERPSREAEGLVLLYIGTLCDAAKQAGVEPYEVMHAILDLIGFSWAKNGWCRAEALEFAAHQIAAGYDLAAGTCLVPGGVA